MMPIPGGCQATMQYRLRVSADASAVQLHNHFDHLIGEILDLERQHGLLYHLLPGGAFQGHRKQWSWFGVLADGRDFGNWGYAVIMRSLFHGSVGLSIHDVCGDVLMGDVVEATLHLGYNLYRFQAPFSLYATLFNEVCTTFERIETWARSLGYWESSRVMAQLLL